MQKILIAAMLFLCGCLSAEETNTSVKAAKLPQLLIVGIQCRTSNANGAGNIDIPKLWMRFFNEQVNQKIPNKVSNEIIALYCDYESDFNGPFSLVIGCPVTSLSQVPEGMIAKVVPASTYAVFTTTGEFPKNLVDTWRKIWQLTLPRSYTGDMEIYGKNFNSESREIQVCIALK